MIGQGTGIKGRQRLISAGVAFFMTLICLMFASPEVWAFTARTLGDHGNITVMEVTGNYDAKNPDGTSNSIPRQEIAKEFYRLHKDEYDFLVIFSNFGFQMPDLDAKAFYHDVKNDTNGIGKLIFDHSAHYGSNGKLQGTIDMGDISALTTDPFEPAFEESLDTLSHELMHRWAAFVKFRNPDGSMNSSLLGKDGSHWSFLLNTDASLMYGNTWKDNGNGTFTSMRARKYYSPLDLYLMGFIDKSQVLPMLLIDNPEIDPMQLSQVGITISGTPRYVSIDEIIAAEGERTPGPDSSQKNFKTAFIFITAPGTFTGDELYGLENVRNGWITRVSVLTDGAGLVQVSPSLLDDLPLNPGITPPDVTGRTVPPSIDDGVSWLRAHQQMDGSWLDTLQTAERDTVASLLALRNFTEAASEYHLGIEWIGSADSETTDYLARRIIVLSGNGREVSLLVNEIISRQNDDGGWGSFSKYESNPNDTALAIRALAVTGHGESAGIRKAVAYLKTKEQADGSWSNDGTGSLQCTANVLIALKSLNTALSAGVQIDSAVAWLSQKQNPDGGFGNSPSTIHDTAIAMMTLRELNAAVGSMTNAVNYLLELQSGDGSWNESPYQTALAVEAIWNATVQPDLSIRSSDISFQPDSITALPSAVVVNAVVTNSGRTAVDAVRVALYDGSASEVNRIGEQLIAVPAVGAFTALFPVTIKDGNEHRFIVVVDTDNAVAESNELNNSAMQILRPVSTYDFAVPSDGLTASASRIDLSQNVRLSARISNTGTIDAYNVQVRYFVEIEGTQHEIATRTIDLPANATVTDEAVWKADLAGEDLPVTVEVDPTNFFAELSETNNQATTLISVNRLENPNITLSYTDMTISPSPALERGNAQVSLLVKNEGLTAAQNIVLDVYLGVPGAGGGLIGSRTIPSLDGGAASMVTVDWNDIRSAGSHVIYAQADPDNTIQEIREDDNDAFVTLDILSLPDLAITSNSIVFQPAAPKEGDSVTIEIRIKNLGRQAASGVTVKVYDETSEIGSSGIATIDGNSEATAAVSYDSAVIAGAHVIRVEVDPEDLILEQDEGNNSASKTLGVQDADLWLTEPYFSPNGDGIKDSTALFFRLPSLQTVNVIVVNQKNETVRTFSGADIENVDSGNVVWDGLSDSGMVVSDGQYRLKVVNPINGSVLGSILAVVDTNRSPLTDALGTKYFINNNLTCMLPYIPLSRAYWQWLPNESGILFRIAQQDLNNPEFTPGLYVMGPDGGDIERILASPFNGDNLWVYAVSPNGQEIAFITDRYDEQSTLNIERLWVMTIENRNIQLLDTKVNCRYTCPQDEAGFDSSDLRWSPDSKSVAYFTWIWGSATPYSLELWSTDITTRSPVKIDAGTFSGIYYNQKVAWSPDSRKLAYFYATALDGEVRIADQLGNTLTLDLLGPSEFIWLDWIGNDHILVEKKMPRDYTNPLNVTGLMLINTESPADSTEISLVVDSYAINPKTYDIAFVEYKEDTAYVKLADKDGRISILYKAPELLEYTEGYEGNIRNFSWLQSGDNLAFIDMAALRLDSCIVEPHLITVNSTNNDISETKLNSGQCYSNAYCSWSSYLMCNQNHGYAESVQGWTDLFSDEDRQVVILMDGGYPVMNWKSGKSEGSLPLKRPSDSLYEISPLGRYITYLHYVEENSSCNDKRYPDLWSLSSAMNLTADLRAVKNKSSLVFKGVAADLNFEGYRLEYADESAPETWQLITPPSDTPVINDTFTTWVPPHEGTFFVRLTVWDKAGNTAIDKKRVSWGLSSSIINLYKSADIFSPNGDGIKDTVSLNYTVLEPVHLDFSVRDQNGRLVRSYAKDHAVRGADSIVWDGRDMSGNVMPDSIYSIKVFDYEFFVEVDNTPPTAKVNLSGVRQNIKIGSYIPLAVYLTGHAYDVNLAEFVIEYGEGDNPQQWTAQLIGHDSLAGRDAGGHFFNPAQDIDMAYYLDQEIANLSGKRFRITVRDKAGNRTTYLSNMLDEKMYLYWHSWGGFIDGAQEYFRVGSGENYPNLILPVEHMVEGISTTRLPLTSSKLQYWNGLQWYDMVIDGSSSGNAMKIAWDKDSMPSDVSAVRLAGIDETGQQYYSNIVQIRSLFAVDSCAALQRMGMNYLFEPLKGLRLQIRSNQDSRYSEWTDYLTMEGSNIPVGDFSIAPLPEMNQDMEYFIRMIGTGESGEIYISNESKMCSGDQASVMLHLSVAHLDAKCNSISMGMEQLSAAYEVTPLLASIRPLDLQFVIQRDGVDQLLSEIDMTKAAEMKISVDTTAMPEGAYPIRAVLSYLDDGDSKIHEVRATNMLVVDRVMPTARITYPGDRQVVCPISNNLPDRNWLGIPIEGEAIDDHGVKHYEIKYAVGVDRSDWIPARTPKYDSSTKEIKSEPIDVLGPKKGTLGLWDVTGLNGGEFSIQLKVVDMSGNATCFETSLTTDTGIVITSLSLDNKAISPNEDSVLDITTVRYQVDEYANLSVRVYRLIPDGQNSYRLDDASVRTIAENIQHLGGEGIAQWDGYDDGGNVVPDGKYAIALSAADSCNNDAVRWVEVEVDNTPPIAQITYPQPSGTIGSIIEVRGSVDDPHFSNYVIEAGQGDNPLVWQSISQGTHVVMDDSLGTWNTYGLGGVWSLRLTASDRVGNTASTVVTVDLGSRTNIIREFGLIPALFSPNGDYRRDTTEVRYSVTAACSVRIDIIDSEISRRSYTLAVPAAGSYSFIWDGRSETGNILPDGHYSVSITASLLSDPLVTQEEQSTITIDTQPPTVDIKHPTQGSVINDTELQVFGTISDNNLANYAIEFEGNMLDSGSQNRVGYLFGILDNLPEEQYILHVTASDAAENSLAADISLTIDRTPPKVKLDTPKDGEYYGETSSGLAALMRRAVTITGSIVEANIDTYSLRYGFGATPTIWTELISGSVVPSAPDMLVWNVGEHDGIPDGLYSISLLAKDKAGQSGEARVTIIVDNTVPEVAITAPADGAYLLSSSDIIGTANDANLQKYIVELSDGSCDTAKSKTLIRTGISPVHEGSLASMKALPPDGSYCLRLSASDKSGNEAYTAVHFRVDTTPPAAPVLAATKEERSNIRLTWPQNAEADLAGYNLYRGVQKINDLLIEETTYLDRQLSEGVHTYTLKAVDLAGNESLPSNEISLNIDLTGPDAAIRSPKDGSRVSGLVDIMGTAYSKDDFRQYRLSVGLGTDPAAWSVIRVSPLPLTYDKLARWDTFGLTEEQYALKLEAEDLSGNITTSRVLVTVDNTPPAAPVLLTATPSSSDVALAWQSSGEEDLAGYLLYRNDQIANISGIVVGNLKPYLISATVYQDRSLPDGTYHYYLMAMDEAGNLSDQSNALEVTIDTRAPHALIADPADGFKFDSSISVRAESPDIDIDHIQFQYKEASALAWTNVGLPLTAEPYVINLDPQFLALVYGSYDLRAVATDRSGKTDSAPAAITVTYVDITAPAVPHDTKAVVDGTDITLAWASDTEADLDGYNIYRMNAGWRKKINQAVLKTPDYLDKMLSDGLYTYEVTAVDTAGNESDPSEAVSAKVYAPIIIQPYTPVYSSSLEVKGSGAASGSSVEILVDSGSGPSTIGNVAASASGDFSYRLNLTVGENSITAKASDNAGNRSRLSDIAVVVFDERPAAPTGLISMANNFTVDLSWDPNVETDIAGYHVYRDGQELVNYYIVATTPSASSTYASYAPSNAVDNNYNTSWLSQYSYGSTDPVWFELSLPTPELIRYMEVDWWGDWYAGQDFEIQAWTGHAWLPLKSIVGNTSSYGEYAIEPAYRTDKIRIHITKGVETGYYSRIGISEVHLWKDDLVADISYADKDLGDGKYEYHVTAVDWNGFESLPSEPTTVSVGDTMPPSPPANLTAAVEGQDITLSWTVNTESDLAHYIVYRQTSTGWLNLGVATADADSYIDRNLPLGAYVYRITAVDQVGNESLPSDEVSAVINSDSIAPPQPVIIYPTIAGVQKTVSKNSTDIAGFAEPGSFVELVGLNGLLDMTTALEEERAQNYSIDWIWRGSVSPDANLYAYLSDADSSVWIQSPQTGEKVRLADEGDDLAWSSDGRKLAYSVWDGSSGYWRIALYDVGSETSEFLVDAPNDDEYSPSWSDDGRLLLFIRGSDVWLQDRNSGEFAQVTFDIAAWYAKISPDGKKIAYSDDSMLRFQDLAGGAPVSVYDWADWQDFVWSPDSSQILFVGRPAQKDDLFIYNVASGSVGQITDNTDYKYYPGWSPDGKSILFASWNGSEDIINIISLDNGQSQVFRGNLYLYQLEWLRSGAISYVDSSTLSLVLPKGYFFFDGVPLGNGENLFSAFSVDASGKISQTSDEISVIFDDSMLPDLSVSSDDIYLYPASPVAGEVLSANIVIWNSGTIDAHDVGVDVYVMDSAGNLDLVKSDLISVLPSGLAEVEGIYWNTTGKSGVNKIMVVVDPLDSITEQSEENNYTEKAVVVADHQGVSMSAILNSESFSSNSDVIVSLSIIDTVGRAATLDLRVEDEAGFVVATLFGGAELISAGMTEKTFTWNTGSTLSGSYKMHAVLTDPEGTLSDVNLPFAIIPDRNIDGVLTTDRKTYSAWNNVILDYSIQNGGSNVIRSGLTALVRIVDATGAVLMSDEKTLNSLMPGASVSLQSSWNTGQAAPGTYSAILHIYDATASVSASQAVFTIDNTLVLSASVELLSNSVCYGDDISLDYVVQNTGNSSLDSGLLRVVIVDPETMTEISGLELPVSVAAGQSSSGRAVLSSVGLGLKNYTVALRIAIDGRTESITSRTVSIQDCLPPVMQIISPGEGSIHNTTFDISLKVTDDLSGIKDVQYRLDDGSWGSLPISDAVEGRYQVILSPTSGEEGLRRVGLRAVDKAGNWTTPIVRTITIDMTPPVLIVSSLADGSWTANGVLNIAGSAVDSVALSQVLLNDEPIPLGVDGTFSKAIMLNEGQNTVTVKAFDTAGNVSTDIRVINLDSTAPVIRLDDPADNSSTGSTPITVAGAVDEEVVATIGLNGGDPIPLQIDGGLFSTSVLPGYGINTIEVTAVDHAGNSSSVKRTITFDDRSPAISITNPAEDMKTNQSEILVEGTVEDLSSVSVTVTINGSDYSPPVTEGRFEQLIHLESEKTYEITVRAVDELGNESIARRNIILDITPPYLGIDPVTSPTNLDTQILTGQMEAGSVLRVTCPGAGVGEITYPGSETWSLMLSDLQEGLQTVTIDASDDLGNVSAPVTADILVDFTAPDVTILFPASGTDYSTSVHVDILTADSLSGVASVEYSIDGGPWVQLQVSDQAEGRYITEWQPQSGDMGGHRIDVRATDMAGNISLIQSVDFVVGGLTGSISAMLNPVYQGKDEVLSYSIINRSTDIPALQLKITISESASGSARKVFAPVISLAGNTTGTGNITFSTVDLDPGFYNAFLEIVDLSAGTNTQLAATSFEVKDSLEAQLSIADVTNLLVWLNSPCSEGNRDDSDHNEATRRSDCRSGRGEGRRDCIGIDRLEHILEDAVTGYSIVYERKEFQDELRNSYFTDILIIGGHDPLEDHAKAELTEKVNAGMGLISSRWTMPGDGAGDDSAILPDLRISLFTDSMSFGSGGSQSEAAALRPVSLSVAAVSYSGDDDDDDPAIIYNSFGLGRTVYIPFDLLSVLDDTDRDGTFLPLEDALSYVHRNSADDRLMPGMMIPLETKLLRLGGALKISISESRPTSVYVYDPATGVWIKDNPWSLEMHLNPFATETILHYLLLPDRAGMYPLMTEIATDDGGGHHLLQSLRKDIVLEEDTKQVALDIIAALNAKSVSLSDRARIKNADRYIQNTMRRTIADLSTIEKNIGDILAAINVLKSVRSSTMTEERLMLDRLLGIWQSRWYYFDLGH